MIQFLIEMCVVPENTPVVKVIRIFIRDINAVFSISSPRILASLHCTAGKICQAPVEKMASDREFEFTEANIDSKTVFFPSRVIG